MNNNQFTNMRKNILFAMTATLAVVSLLSSCGGKKEQQAAAVVEFKTTKVAKENITLDAKYSATIRGRQDIEVYPQVAGTLQKLCVVEGQSVSKGQTLFIIDQVPYQAALNTAEAALKAAQAQEATAQLTYESRKQLFDKQVVSEYDLQTAQNTLLTAKASVAQAQAQVVNARNSLSYTVVKSPANGVVGTLPFRQGALVGPSMPQALTTVSDNNQMYVYFSITENQFLELTRKAGSAEKAVKEMPAVKLQLVDGSMYESTGTVETASGVVDRSTGSIQLRAVFDNAAHLLHSGSTGNVIVPIEYKDVLTVPAAGVVQTQDKYKVYVVDKEGVAHSKIINVMAQNNGKQFIVTEGLDEGMEIVAEGASMVKEDQKVKK